MTVSILVVDDESDVADLFRQRFRREVRQGVYVLHFAFSGEEALEQLASEIEPELIVILSDINMPGMDGLALLREIKQRRPGLPVMMVTATMRGAGGPANMALPISCRSRSISTISNRACTTCCRRRGKALDVATRNCATRIVCVAPLGRGTISA